VTHETEFSEVIMKSKQQKPDSTITAVPQDTAQLFVGRESELATLQQTLQTALTGRGQLLFVKGEAGSGKTALLVEFAQRAQAAHDQLVVVYAACNAQTGAGDPLSPFRQILNLLVGDDAGSGGTRALNSENQRRLREVGPLAGDIATKFGPDLVSVQGIDTTRNSFRPRLRQGLVDCFNEEELHTLCFDMELDYESLPAQGKAGKAREIVAYFERTNSISRLVEWCRCSRPNGPWGGMPEQLLGANLFGASSSPSAATVFEKNNSGHLFEQYASVLRNLAAKHPLILVLDDLQWVDRASADLLSYLGQRLAESRILLIGLFRFDEVAFRQGQDRHPLEKVIAELERKLGDISSIDLDRAGVAEGRRFVDALLDAEPNCLDEVFRAALFQHAEGQPLFTVELLRMMREQGSLTHDAQGRCVTGSDVNWDKLPARMEGLLDERVGRLDDELKQALQVASVEGQAFTAQVVARAVKLDESRLLLRLSNDAERQHRLVEQRGEFTTDTHILTRFMFSHLLFQQHFYQLAGAARRSLHGAVGALLEELYDGQTDAIAVQLARHFEEAMVWAKATEYSLRAGEQAQRIYACADAIGHFERALACAAKIKSAALPAQLLRAHQGLGELLTITGPDAPAREHLREAQALAHATQDGDAEARSCRWLARSYENDGQFAPALEWVEHGLEALAGQVTVETAQLRLIAGLIYQRRGEIKRAAAEAKQALEVGQAIGDSRALARAHLLLAVLALHRGENQHSIEQAQQALGLYTSLADIAGQATANNQIANALFNLGRWSEADTAYRQAQAAFVRIGDLYNRAFVENNLGEIALPQGRLDDARDFYQDALRDLKASGGSPYVMGVLHNNLGAVYVQRGELTLAREQLQGSLECFTEAQSRDILPELHRHLAEIARQEGDLAEAEAEGQRSLALAEELQAENEGGITRRLLGELALERTDLPTAAVHLNASLATLDALGETFQAARARLALARLALAGCRYDAARVELDTCAPVFARLETAPELAAVEKLKEALAQQIH
jgi:predicted ATPase